MDLVSNSFVGGASTSGWSVVDPSATPIVVEGGQVVYTTAGLPVFGGYTPVYQPGYSTDGGGASYGNQVLYGVYSPAGNLATNQGAFALQPNFANPAIAPTTTVNPAPTSTPTTAAAPTTPAAATTKPAEPKKPAAAEKKPEPKPVPKTVTVKSGDSLSKIAAAHGMSWQKLYDLNKGVVGGNPNLIRPGQELKLS